MYNQLWKHYQWVGMKEQVCDYVKHCQCCQQSKCSNQKTTGKLMLLPMPQGPWQDISIDFVDLLKLGDYDCVMTVVDRFSKEVVFVPCTRAESLLSTTELFRDHVWAQHGLPTTIVSDRGAQFTLQFMGELYKILGIK